VDREPDEVLVERLRRGDGAAFRQLVLKYQRPLYNAAYRVLGREEDARDITQVVFLRIAERLEGYDARYKFFSWVYRIALNESLNLLRRAGREEQLADDADETAGAEGADPESQLAAAQVSQQVQRALMQMKFTDRAVLTLRHFSECSYEEIAEILELKVETVKSRLFDARGRLRKLLKHMATA
jgi:RNA polymerase sigma-70 factor (ECF subfamily)